MTIQPHLDYIIPCLSLSELCFGAKTFTDDMFYKYASYATVDCF